MLLSARDDPPRQDTSRIYESWRPAERRASLGDKVPARERRASRSSDDTFPRRDKDDSSSRGYDSYHPKTSPRDENTHLPSRPERDERPHTPGPRSSRFDVAPTPTNNTATPTSPAANLTMSDKLLQKMALECSLKIISRNEDMNPIDTFRLPFLLRALHLPNLLQLEHKPGAVYIRLTDWRSAKRIASTYTTKGENLLRGIKVSSPADYAPALGDGVMAEYAHGARRLLLARGWNGKSERKGITEAVRKLWGYLDEREDEEGIWVGFEGVESAVAGRKILGNKFKGVKWDFMEERA